MQWKNVQMYYSYKVLERIADLCVLLYYFIQTKSYQFDLTDKLESWISIEYYWHRHQQNIVLLTLFWRIPLSLGYPHMYLTPVAFYIFHKVLKWLCIYHLCVLFVELF